MQMMNGISRRNLLATGLAATLAGALAGRVRAQDAEIRIAIAAPMTGDAASMGLNAQRGAAAAIEMINAAGGVNGKAIAIDFFDDMGTPKEAASVARRIVDAGVYALVVGHVNSSCTLAAMPIYAEVDMPVMCGSSSNSAVTESGWTNIIRCTIRDDFGAQQYSAYAVNNLGKKKLGILFANDDFGRGLRDKMMKAAEVLGADVVAEAGFTPNVDKDFSAIITDFMSKGVEVFMLNCNYTEGGLFLGQAQGLGVTGIPTVGPDSLLYNEFIELAQGAAEGANVLAAYDPYSANPATVAFMAKFKADYDALPSQVAVFTCDLLMVAQQLLAAGTAPADLITAAKAGTFEGVGGTYKWDEKGDVKDRTFAVISVKDGAFASTGVAVDETGLEALR